MAFERNTLLLVVGFTSPVTTAKGLKHAKDIDELFQSALEANMLVTTGGICL